MIETLVMALALSLPPAHPAAPMPASAFIEPFNVTLNRGPGGRFASGGCMELAVQLGEEGRARQITVIRSSTYRQIDLAVVDGLKAYSFNTADLLHGTSWSVFFSWSADGRQTYLSNACT